MANDTGYSVALEDAIEPIAIIGLSCRFPGEATSPAGLWEMMANARTGHSKIPADRFNIDAWYHPSNDRRGTVRISIGLVHSGKLTCRLRSMLNLDSSSRKMYHCSMRHSFLSPLKKLLEWIPCSELCLRLPMKALKMVGSVVEILASCITDPISLAGIPIDTLPGSQTAVYCGCFTGDFDLLSNHDIYDQAPNAATGTGRAMLSNRVSWFFDLRGPSFTIDTACSSSLYALHLACQSLRLGESKQVRDLVLCSLVYRHWLHMEEIDGLIV